jgi:aquaporin Z/aquaporin NIP
MTTTMPTSRAESTAAQNGQRRAGLHGHSFDAHLVTVAAVEGVGTFVLVLSIVSAAIAATLAQPIAGPAYSSIAIPLAGGIALAALAATLGPISGAHLNPAVTVALAADRKFPWVRVPIYVISQSAGALGAALIAWWFFGPRARTAAHVGATLPAPNVNAGRIFVVEAVVTFVLVVTILIAARRTPSALIPVAIGGALAIAILISGPVSGGSVNPARSLGPMIVAGTFTDWWVYLTAPFVGGVLAAFCSPALRWRP